MLFKNSHVTTSSFRLLQCILVFWGCCSASWCIPKGPSVCLILPLTVGVFHTVRLSVSGWHCLWKKWTGPMISNLMLDKNRCFLSALWSEPSHMYSSREKFCMLLFCLYSLDDVYMMTDPEELVASDLIQCSDDNWRKWKLKTKINSLTTICMYLKCCPLLTGSWQEERKRLLFIMNFLQFKNEALCCEKNETHARTAHTNRFEQIRSHNLEAVQTCCRSHQPAVIQTSVFH